jgi:L-malate glycosyltransferase
MKIFLLADINSVHTKKIVKGLSHEGIDVAVFSLSRRENSDSEAYAKIYDEGGLSKEAFSAGTGRKISYLKQIRFLKKIIGEFKPDIVHAHYATSYGLLGKLSGFNPFVISAWGSDLLEFPSNKLKQLFLRRILISADELMATSVTLQKAIREISGRNSLITPFGVDSKIFCPTEGRGFFPEGTIVFGTVKSLEHVYGIDILIRAFALVRKNNSLPTGLLIVGDGTKREELETLVNSLGLTGSVIFAGKVEHDKIPEMQNSLNVFVNVSRYESFGVSVLEAMSCAKPVIVTNTGGLAEIVSSENGVKVPVEDVESTADAMTKLLKDKNLRIQMGERGREIVLQKYEWSATIKLMIGAYQKLLSQK